MVVVPNKQKQDFRYMGEIQHLREFGKKVPNSQRGAMKWVGSPLQKEDHFELNYAKKGVLLPPKGGLPPLIGGSLFAAFLYKFWKRESF
jgi:hypothetical protein